MKVLWLVAVPLAAVGAFLALRQDAKPQQDDLTRILASWPAESKKVAEETVAKIGPPHEMCASLLLWRDVGDWKETRVYRDPVQHDWPMPHTDILEQVIQYKVPPEAADDLMKFDGSVIFERTKGTLAARCDKVDANYLAINLAVDIIHGKTTAEEARKTYESTIEKVMKGEKPDSAQKFLFELPKEPTGDPDQPAASMKP